VIKGDPMNFLNLNQSHIIDRIIPKEVLYENAELTEKEKQYFVDSVERLKFYYALRYENSNLLEETIEDCIYEEIDFIELRLKQTKNIDKILSIVHSAIPKPLLIIIIDQDKISVSISEKNNQGNKLKIKSIYTTSFIEDMDKLKKLAYENIAEKTLAKTYRNYILVVKELIANSVLRDKNINDIEIKRENVDELLVLKNELELLTEKMKKEEQLKKRVEISLEINRVKGELESLR
jgi:CHAT domain-containing protein